MKIIDLGRPYNQIAHIKARGRKKFLPWAHLNASLSVKFYFALGRKFFLLEALSGPSDYKDDLNFF